MNLMKRLVTALYFLIITYSMQAQQLSLTAIKEGNVNEQKFTIKNKKFTLTISGVDAGERISIYREQDSANSFTGNRSGTNMTFVLDEQIDDLTTASDIRFFINDDKAQKNIGSFFLSATRDGLSGKSENTASSSSPVAFYDAQVLYTNLLQLDSSNFKPLLERYNFSFPPDNSAITTIRQNPFFARFLDLYRTTEKITAANGSDAHSMLSGAIASLSGIDVTKYVQATSDFLRDRVKEELAIAFIEKFKTALDTIPELKALLPKTYILFNSSDLFKAPSLGQTYKTAFGEDLTGFVENFEIFIDTTTKPRYTGLKNSQAITAFRIAYHTIELSANDTHPIDIFEFLDARFGVAVNAGNNREINRYVSLLNLLSQNLRNRGEPNKTTNGWITVNDLKSFNPKAALVFWGLLYQQKPDVFNNLSVNNKSFKAMIIEGTATVQVYLKQFIVLAQNIDQRIKGFNDAVAKARAAGEEIQQIAINDFVANADKILEMADFIFGLPYFKNESGQTFYQSAYYTRWRPVITNAIEATKGVYAKNFAKISVNAASLIAHLSHLHQDTVFTKNFLEDFTYYSGFLVDVINADSANEVKAVINRYAEPVRSYRVKRRTNFGVSLNAYPGVYFGWERTQSIQKETARSFGVTAPIGFSFNWGSKQGLSKSIFFNAVDIAAAFSYRWNNDTLDLPEKITLGQIFSPGAYFVLGFPNIPISAKAGLQYVPQLRSITKNGNTLQEIPVVRYGLSVAVDVPVFNFRNRRTQIYK